MVNNIHIGRWEVFHMIFNPHWIGNLMIHVQMEILQYKPNDLLQMISNFGRVYQYYYNIASHKYSNIDDEIISLNVLSKLENDFLEFPLIFVKVDQFTAFTGKLPSMIVVLPLAYTLNSYKGNLRQINSFSIELISENENKLKVNYLIQFIDLISNEVSKDIKSQSLFSELELVTTKYIGKQVNFVKNSIYFTKIEVNDHIVSFSIDFEKTV